MITKEKIEVFLSYSHHDEVLCNELIKNLKILVRQGVIRTWHDRRIKPGNVWSNEIDEHLNNSQVILLLVSPDFIASDYCYDVEMKRALQRHDLGDARVIPIILRPVDWNKSPFGHLQALPKDAKPVTVWENQDEAFLDIIIGIRNVINTINADLESTYKKSYLASITEKYKPKERFYTNLPLSVHPQIPPEFQPTFHEMRSFQVLIERSFGHEYHSIERVQEDNIHDVIAKYSKFVLLGDPGCGKSVTIQKLAFDYAQKALESKNAIWPVIIQLGKYDATMPFSDWLYFTGKNISGFKERLNSGSLIFLLDGLNELPRSDYSNSIDELRKFIANNDKCSYIVTCRRLDYDKTLGLQQVEFEPLDKDTIQLFVSNYIKNENESSQLIEILESDNKLLELASNTLNLSLIIYLYKQVGGNFPRNRSQLIDGFVGALYILERNKSTSTLASEAISESALRYALGKLAFAIHSEVGKGTYISKKWALPHLRSTTPELLLEFVKNMGLLEVTESNVSFQHHLFQEYFAALEMDKQLSNLSDVEVKSQFWIPNESKLSDINKDTLEPIPPPPTTGWEEVTIMLSGTKTDASSLVERISECNPILASRCITDGLASVDIDTRDKVMNKLLQIIENPSNELNIRVQAGLEIGDLYDPRFERVDFDGNHVLLPPLSRVPKGKYFIGSNRSEVSDSYLDEIPRHIVEVSSFSISSFPITNIEFGYFIKDGGYDERSYWTDEGWAWRKGKLGDDLQNWLLDGYRNVRRQVLLEKDRLEPSRAEDSDEMDIWWNILMEWEDDRAESELRQLFQERNCISHNKPCYWDDPSFNKNTQPVITTWFEAQAYCNWLSKITGKKYRLPTEVEWEVSTGGSSQKYPWGDKFNSSNCNILSTGIFHTTPVGIFPNGISKYGLYDLIGNVWEWTSSAKFPYPYTGNDKREEPFLPDSRRVVRGGSWAVSEQSARNSCRGNFPPDNLVKNYIGFRVVCDD